MIRQEQCDKVCRILDDVLANRPTERDSLIVAVQKAFDALEQSKWTLCKDCIYQTESWIGIKYCEAHGDHIGKDYDYCSNARRKENGH